MDRTTKQSVVETPKTETRDELAALMRETPTPASEALALRKKLERR